MRLSMPGVITLACRPAMGELLAVVARLLPRAFRRTADPRSPRLVEDSWRAVAACDSAALARVVSFKQSSSCKSLGQYNPTTNIVSLQGYKPNFFLSRGRPSNAD